MNRPPLPCELILHQRSMTIELAIIPGAGSANIRATKRMHARYGAWRNKRWQNASSSVLDLRMIEDAEIDRLVADGWRYECHEREVRKFRTLAKKNQRIQEPSR